MSFFLPIKTAVKGLLQRDIPGFCVGIRSIASCAANLLGASAF